MTEPFKVCYDQHRIMQMTKNGDSKTETLKSRRSWFKWRVTNWFDEFENCKLQQSRVLNLCGLVIRERKSKSKIPCGSHLPKPFQFTATANYTNECKNRLGVKECSYSVRAFLFEVSQPRLMPYVLLKLSFCGLYEKVNWPGLPRSWFLEWISRQAGQPTFSYKPQNGKKYASFSKYINWFCRLTTDQLTSRRPYWMKNPPWELNCFLCKFCEINCSVLSTSMAAFRVVANQESCRTLCSNTFIR